MLLKIVTSAILLLLLNLYSFAQTNFAFSVKGGVNYTPMRGVQHDVISWDKSQMDRFNYSAIAGLKYSFNDKHSVAVAFEYQPVSLSYGSYFSDIQYRLKFYSLVFGYNYKFIIAPKFNYYLGASAGYILLNSKVTNFSTPWPKPAWFKDEGWLLNFKFGGEYNLSELLTLTAELRYRYVKSLIRNKYNNLNDVNISGISLLIGFNFNI